MVFLCNFRKSSIGLVVNDDLKAHLFMNQMFIFFWIALYQIFVISVCSARSRSWKSYAGMLFCHCIFLMCFGHKLSERRGKGMVIMLIIIHFKFYFFMYNVLYRCRTSLSCSLFSDRTEFKMLYFVYGAIDLCKNKHWLNDSFASL